MTPACVSEAARSQSARPLRPAGSRLLSDFFHITSNRALRTSALLFSERAIWPSLGSETGKPGGGGRGQRQPRGRVGPRSRPATRHTVPTRPVLILRRLSSVQRMEP